MARSECHADRAARPGCESRIASVRLTKVRARGDTGDAECRRAVVAQCDGVRGGACAYHLVAKDQACRRQSNIGSGTAHAIQGKYLWTAHTIRSEEHTSELQSLRHLVCRLLL